MVVTGQLLSQQISWTREDTSALVICLRESRFTATGMCWCCLAVGALHLSCSPACFLPAVWDSCCFRERQKLPPLPPLSFLWGRQGSQVQLHRSPLGVPREVVSHPLRLWFDAILLSSAHCSASEAIWPCRWAPALDTSESVAKRLFVCVLILPFLCRVCAVGKGTAFVPRAREPWRVLLAGQPKPLLHPLQVHLCISCRCN